MSKSIISDPEMPIDYYHLHVLSYFQEARQLPLIRPISDDICQAMRDFIKKGLLEYCAYDHTMHLTPAGKKVLDEGTKMEIGEMEVTASGDNARIKLLERFIRFMALFLEDKDKELLVADFLKLDGEYYNAEQLRKLLEQK